MGEHVLALLKEIVGPENMVTEQAMPVVKPGTPEEISKILLLANNERFPVYTGYTDNTYEKPNKGLCICFDRLNRVVEVDTANLVAVIEPGVTICALNQMLEQFGLFYPLDPGRGLNTTFGETVAENLAGLRGLKYGATKHYVMGLEVVLADGRTLKTGGKNVKDVSGYDMTKLITGANDTLGIVTKIIVKLMPAPEEQRILAVCFDDAANTGKAVSAIWGAKITPSALEILDSVTLNTLADAGTSSFPIAAAVVMLEIDGIPAAVEKTAQTIMSAMRDCNATDILQAVSTEDRSRLWASRQAVTAAFAAKSALQLDMTIPRPLLPQVLVAAEQISRQLDIAIGVYGHAGEGNLFASILPGSQHSAEKLQQVQSELFQMLRNLGGQLSGKPEYIEPQYGAAGAAAMQSMKRTLDPNCILNPGKLVGAC